MLTYKTIKMLLDDFIILLLMIAMLGVFFGYGWRWVQDARSEVKAFEAGKEAAMVEFRETLKRNQGIHHYQGFRVIPRDDGRFTLEVEK